MEGQLVALAKELSQGRHALAQELEAEIQQELADLYMEKAALQAFYPTCLIWKKRLSLYFNQP